MQVECTGCGKTTPASRPTCLYCGTPTAVPRKCVKCGRDVIRPRTTCQYCGGAAIDPGASPLPQARPIEQPRPTAMKVAAPRATIGMSWMDAHESEIDGTLFVLALPIALLAIASSVAIHALVKMMGANR